VIDFGHTSPFWETQQGSERGGVTGFALNAGGKEGQPGGIVTGDRGSSHLFGAERLAPGTALEYEPPGIAADGGPHAASRLMLRGSANLGVDLGSGGIHDGGSSGALRACRDIHQADSSDQSYEDSGEVPWPIVSSF
jgi:hypothetical protein